MFITIYCGGMPFDGSTIKNGASLGGSESAAFYMARALSARGHDVVCFTSCTKPMIADGVKYQPCGEHTEQTPLGRNFHAYAENTPHDALIIQRIPQAFRFQFASKRNYLWLHDLALPQNRDDVMQVMHNIDAVLCVSEWHKDQVISTWGLNERSVKVVSNGVDLSLYEKQADKRLELVAERLADQTKPVDLLYSSRPERGLENLVKEGGIMESLPSRYHLHVCAYDNVTEHMRPYYEYLWGRCRELENVTLHGSLSKAELAALQESCHLYTYPTEFEETSCITAMEAMASYTPMLTTEVGALPETTKPGSVPTANIQDFVQAILHYFAEVRESPAGYVEACKIQRKAAEDFYDWNGRPADLMEQAIKRTWLVSDGAMLRHLIRNSDILAAKEYAEKCGNNAIVDRVRLELEQCYGFAYGANPDLPGHYKAYYEYESARGVEYGPEDVTRTPRFMTVKDMLLKHEPVTVIDYGCAHGHYTIALAKMFPNTQFIGLDITQSNVDKAIEWAKDEGLSNVEFHCAHTESDNFADFHGSADLVIAAEVLEHVPYPVGFLGDVEKLANASGVMVITTPYGPWEAVGYEEHHPWRAHLHHFDRADIIKMVGHREGFRNVCVPGGRTAGNEVVGSYVYEYRAGGEINHPDYSEKYRNAEPRQTVSMCMIARDAEDSILKCLRSAKPLVDEIIIGLDPEDKGLTQAAISQFRSECKLWPVVTVFYLADSPTVQGFDAARNETIDKASGDWIFWMDADEVLDTPEALIDCLRNNAWDGYGIPQHHLSVQPAGLIKTDYPVRLFRNWNGVKFFGVVHEHPETGVNKGPGHIVQHAGASIAHVGYQNEMIRRERFKRNFPLMKRDREQYPERWLGLFLWVRDAAQLIGYTAETGAPRNPELDAIVDDGIECFHKLVSAGQDRLAVEAIDWYSQLVGYKTPDPYPIAVAYAEGPTARVPDSTIKGAFLDKDDARNFVDLVTRRAA